MPYSDVLRMVREALGASDYESVLDASCRVRAEARALRSEVDVLRAAAKVTTDHEADVRSALGATDTESTVDAARRVRMEAEARSGQAFTASRAGIYQINGVEVSLGDGDQIRPAEVVAEKPRLVHAQTKCSVTDRPETELLDAALETICGVRAELVGLTPPGMSTRDAVRALRSEVERLRAEKAAWSTETKEALETASKDGMRRGADGMRSACAKLARDIGRKPNNHPLVRALFDEVGASIERLPLPPE